MAGLTYTRQRATKNTGNGNRGSKTNQNRKQPNLSQRIKVENLYIHPLIERINKMSQDVPPPCDPEIFEKGETILVASRESGLSQDTERWIKQAAALSGQKIDWHYFAGYISIRALGNIEKAIKAVQELKPSDVELWEPE
jgi:hypothetical protein